MKLSRPHIGVAMSLGLAVIAGVTALKIHSMLQRGEPVVWLAELWAPAAFLSIGLVTCLEFFLLPGRPAPGPKAPQKKRRAKAGRR